MAVNLNDVKFLSELNNSFFRARSLDFYLPANVFNGKKNHTFLFLAVYLFLYISYLHMMQNIGL